MKYQKIKSYCKINLFLKVVKKLNNGYHSIASLVTFCNLHDVIFISKINSSKDKIIFSGRFRKGIKKKSNTITKTLNLLRKEKFLKNQAYKINIEKNIPQGSGLGGGSSNAAALLNYFNLKMGLKIKNKKMEKLANKIGSDVPILLKKRNTFLLGKKTKLLRINRNFNLNLLIVYPNFNCSTKKIYAQNKEIGPLKSKPFFNIKSRKKIINRLKNEKNDLEKTVVSTYPKVKKIIDYIKLQKGCCFSRITGSGSACIGIFSRNGDAIYAQKLIKSKYPKYWSAVSKTI